MPIEAASGLWRSEDMSLIQLHMQRECAHDSVLFLGRLGMFQFQDLNKTVNAFQRDFAAEVRRCDDMDRKLRFLQDEIAKANIVGVASPDAIEADTLNTLERKIEEKDAEMRVLNEQFEALVAERNACREHFEVLATDFGKGLDGNNAANGGLTVIAGVIPTDKLPMFHRLIYRATRGNSIIRTEPIALPFFNLATNEAVQKTAFGVFFSATRLTDKLKKICEVNGAAIYNYADGDRLAAMRKALQQQGDSLSDTLKQTSMRRGQLLASCAAVVPEWRRAVLTEKSVFTILNMLQFQGATVVARGWCPVSELDNVRAALRDAEIAAGASVATVIEEVPTKETRPTFFKTNKVTSNFQAIVDSYGIARYKEVNPGVFTVITFPYLFGVMYGDIGHGLMLTLFASFLIFMEKTWEGKPLNEIFQMIFGGRYLLFFMGIFATYVGVLYNDIFGFSAEMFSSGYKWPELPPYGESGVVHPTSPNGLPNIKPANPVAFGIDSAWSETDNKLEFYNSVKMKSAVVIGVVQMIAGLFLSLMNYLHFNDMKSVYFRFIPEIVFLSCTFGYMCLMIIVKWCTTWENTNDAPSLLETMTNFFLAPGTVNVPLYAGQAGVQVVLLLIAVVCVPVLLCVIPYLEKKENDEKEAAKAAGRHVESHGEEDEHEEPFDFSEVMIHQIIHCIEYVLGCVSNTASYLRLWALSLAHAQLSDVFWNFAFMMTVGLDGGSGVFIFAGFAVWISATIGVLLGMEALSAFLHSLRLHWVEFQNKFYFGDGVQFTPFDLPAILTAAEHAMISA